MAESDSLQCEPCLDENVPKSASKWCTDCKENLCDECCRRHKAHKMSKNHHVIQAEDYHMTEKLNVNLECPDHNKQFDFYCPTHDCVVCVVCVQLQHVGCNDLKPLDEAAKGARTSTVLYDMEQAIDNLLENIEIGVRHLQQNATNLKEQEDVTKKSIAKKRAEINKHLNRLEKKLLKALKSKTEKAVTDISLMTTKFETKRKNILDLKETARNMKQFLSNLQVFVGILSVLKTVGNEINGIKLLVSAIPQLSVAVKINPKFETLTEAVDSLGIVQFTSEKAVVSYVERRLIQVQYQGQAEPQVHKIDNLQLKLRTNIKLVNTTIEVVSCIILPNKSVIIASNNRPFLTILKEDGSHERDIRVPHYPYDVTLLDDQTVAVSYGTSATCISIINIKTQDTNKTLENLWGIRGITYNDGKLYAVVPGEGIKVIDQEGNIIKTIRIYNDAWSTYKVTTQKNKIYYSVSNGSIHCVDMEGKEIWTCQDGRLCCRSYTSPAIAVNNYGNTFAAGNSSYLLMVISPDGKQQRVLLTSSDGLQYPDSVFYDNDRKLLLVCNYRNGHAALYDVIY